MAQKMISEGSRQDGRVRNWLLLGVFMLIVQIILGGITRLTGSGLSITEWDIVTGTLPPLSEAAWLEEFAKYRQTPQFNLLNSDFTLGDFKGIFFWEWFHRFWARMMGVVFAAGFVYFLFTRQFKQYMVKPLLVLFVLGALQGAVGWLMVASGLVGDMVYVKPTRLAIHFVFALVLLSYTWWFYLQLKVKEESRQNLPFLQKLVIITLFFLAIQLAYGALMAGHKGATAAPTWPTINGAWFIPAGIWNPEHGMLNFIDNKIMVHFVHRLLALVLAILGISVSFRVNKKALDPAFRKWTWWPAIFIVVQVTLGVLAVLTSLQIVPNNWGIFEWMAQLHQVVAMLFMLSLVTVYYYSRGSANKK